MSITINKRYEDLLSSNITKYVKDCYKFDIKPTQDIKEKIYQTFINNDYTNDENNDNNDNNIYEIPNISNFLEYQNNQYFSKEEVLKYIDEHILLDNNSIKKILSSKNTLSNLLFLLYCCQATKEQTLFSKDKLSKYKYKNRKFFTLIQQFENLNVQSIKHLEILFPEYKEIIDILAINEQQKIKLYYDFIKLEKFENVKCYNLDSYHQYKTHIKKKKEKKFQIILSNEFQFNFLERSLEDNQKLLEQYPEIKTKILEQYSKGKNINVKEVEYFFDNLYNYKEYKHFSNAGHYVNIITNNIKDINFKYKILKKYILEQNDACYLGQDILLNNPELLKDKDIFKLFIKELKERVEKQQIHGSNLFEKKIITLIDKCKEFNLFIDDEIINYFNNVNENKNKETEIGSKLLSKYTIENIDNHFKVQIFKHKNSSFLNKEVANILNKKISNRDIFMLANLKVNGKLEESIDYFFEFLQKFKLTPKQFEDFEETLKNCFDLLDTETKIKILEKNKKVKIDYTTTAILISSIKENKIQLEYVLKFQMKRTLEMNNLNKEELKIIIDNNLRIRFKDESSVINLIDLYKNCKEEDKKKYGYYILYYLLKDDHMFRSLILKHNLTEDILLRFPNFSKSEPYWLQNIKDLSYAISLYNKHLIDEDLFVYIFNEINIKSLKETEISFIKKILNKTPNEKGLKKLLQLDDNFKASDINSLDLLNIFLENMYILNVNPNFTFKNFRNKELLQAYCDSKVELKFSSIIERNIILRDFMNELPERVFIRSYNKWQNHLEFNISDELINRDRSLNTLDKFIPVKGIFLEIEPEIAQNILNAIIEKNDEFKLLVFIASLKETVLDFETYNKLLCINDKNTNPKNHNKYLDDLDYKYIEQKLPNRFLQHSFLYRRIFKSAVIENIDINKNLKDVDLFAFFNFLNRLNLKFEQFSNEDLNNFIYLYNNISSKNLHTFINLLPKKSIYGLHNIEYILQKDSFINNIEFINKVLELMKFNILVEKYPEQLFKINNIFNSTITNIIIKIEELKKNISLIEEFKPLQLIKYINMEDYADNDIQDSFAIALKYISKDVSINPNKNTAVLNELDALITQPLSSLNIKGYQELLNNSANSNDNNINNVQSLIPLYKGIIEKDNEILIYEYVNTAKTGDDISIDNCKAIMSHEPLDCCLTYSGAAQSILEYSIKNSEHCGYFIVSKVTENISKDVLNDLKNRLKLYNDNNNNNNNNNDNKLSLKDQDLLSKIIFSNSIIIGASFTYLKGNCLVFDNIETTRKSFVENENGNNIRYNCTTVPFMQCYVEYSKKALDFNTDIKYSTIGQGYLDVSLTDIKEDLEKETGIKVLKKSHSNPEIIGDGIYTDAKKQKILLDREDLPEQNIKVHNITNSSKAGISNLKRN